MVCSIRRASVFPSTGRLLSGSCCCSKLEVCERVIRCMELRELVVWMGERMRHQWLLERRIVTTASTHVRLKVSSRQLIHAQRIVDVARIRANGISVNNRKLVVQEGIKSMLLLQKNVVRLIHRLGFNLNVVRKLLLLLLLYLFLRHHSVRSLLVILVLSVPRTARLVSL